MASRGILASTRARLEASLSIAWQPLSRTRGGRFAADTVSALRALIHGFRGEYINLRAGNLTFISIFSLVPLVTVALALFGMLHQEGFQARLGRFLQEILAPGIQAESAAFLQRFLTSASSTAAGGLSFFFLLLSAGMLLRHLDASLNDIWAVRRTRPVLVSLLLYALLLTLGPVVLAFWLAGTSTLRTLVLGADLPYAQHALKLGSSLVAVGLLTLIYKLAPHAPVRLRSALAGGLVGGIGWEIARSTYAGFASLGFRYNPIYGSLSAAPLFLTWIYVSWWLVLFGARLSYAVEHAEFRVEFMELVTHPRSKELVAGRIAQLATSALAQGQLPPTPREIARKLRVPAQTVLDLIRSLQQAKLLVLERGGLKPARDPGTLTLADVSAAVGGVAKLLRKGPAGSKNPEFQRLDRLFAEVDDASVERLSRVSWASLVSPLEPAQEEPGRASQNP